ncbi:uncharacterized protein LOC113873369 [Abrus precatorius]|uniref:Uncharacterized protein LOC113873369 n=1 Tax=Abrus precatorius TaxID=3816 RepID=A0A8B8MEY5_ABRPR|nr:uncharacterized protein LOC113873369 [Abrus precatorius]
MFNPCRHKTSHPLQLFSVKSAPSLHSSSALSPMKIKNLIHTLIVSHICRIIRALSKVKAIIVETLKGNQPNIDFLYPSHKKHRRNKISKKIIFGSFRLHYNWCSSRSSHVLPVPSRVFEGLSKASGTHLYYEPDWNSSSVIHDQGEKLQGCEDCHDDSQLVGYLQWLEEENKVHDDGGDKGVANEINEIDVLAEKFIANCHEKFRLEKQESDRRFHDMLARGM